MTLDLNNDLLWHIFMINATHASQTTHERLDTTRNTSQVCQRWRSLILGSPSIWGKLMIIHTNAEKEWMNEVLKRAKDSLLWVDVYCSSTDSQPLPLLFMTICDEKWDRVEVLDIYTRPSETRGPDRATMLLWKLMGRPAPNLRSVTILNRGRNFDKELSKDIFANHAPRLESMTCRLCRITHNFNWLSKITSLAFLPVSIDNLCDILTWTPQLKLLWLNANPDLSHMSEAQCHRLASMSSYILPRLAKICTRISLKAFEALWCTKSRSPIDPYSAHFIDCSQAAPEIDEIQFYKAVENLFYYHRGITNDVDDMQWKLVIHSDINPPIASPLIDVTVKSPSLALVLRFRCTHVPSNTVLAILRSFIPHMTNTTDFLLFAMTSTEFPLEELAQSCRSMTKVVNISVSQESLEWYNHIERSEGLLFPLLRQLDCCHDAELDDYLENVAEFILRRKEAGWPLPTVRISNFNDMRHICKVLSRFHGLRIIWDFDETYDRQEVRKSEVSEFICGESSPLPPSSTFSCTADCCK